jgi:hypothetical protein
MNTKEYLEYQEKCGFKPGDKVLLERGAADYERGWFNSWEPQMSDNIGKTGTVEELGGERGVYIIFPGEEYSLAYPAFCLKTIDETVEASQ